ncbi:MinD/ParA family protein [Tenuibacillus multivorans]|uniref:Flagellar biosynthesis protein FlhG n=1 Tax=Tenuibacillus multivorans TaxID=237069 RepID=A0A1G9XXI1_9BACI|nr:MinD/ParA family protein [Tenuibacillus multivorans]GEL75859.1 flagellum site-determining protein YlxH [Tenuibacillus multivorans]SDN01497.1 flagellar biosynthesis protein FlhG [Tenuibacillus multivorans]
MVKDQAYELRKKVNREHGEKQQAHTIAVFSGKGGVGKSSFALNFAICLSKQGKKVLIFDLDIGMGNIDILLGMYPKHTLTSLLEERLNIEDIIEHGPTNLSYIAAGTGLTDFFHLNIERFEYFLEQLGTVTETYDYIIFDLGAGMSEEHMAFISAADECFVVTTTEPTSITDAYAAIKHIVLDREQVNISLLVNRVSNINEAFLVYERLRAAVNNFLSYEIKLLGSLPDDPAVIKAVKDQMPYYLINSRSRVSKMMAKLVLDYLKEKNELIDSTNSNDMMFVSKLKSLFKRKVE